MSYYKNFKLACTHSRTLMMVRLSKTGENISLYALHRSLNKRCSCSQHGWIIDDTARCWGDDWKMAYPTTAHHTTNFDFHGAWLFLHSKPGQRGTANLRVDFAGTKWYSFKAAWLTGVARRANPFYRFSTAICWHLLKKIRMTTTWEKSSQGANDMHRHGYVAVAIIEIKTWWQTN